MRLQPEKVTCVVFGGKGVLLPAVFIMPGNSLKQTIGHSCIQNGFQGIGKHVHIVGLLPHGLRYCFLLLGFLWCSLQIPRTPGGQVRGFIVAASIIKQITGLKDD